jgi:hypothetical protein
MTQSLLLHLFLLFSHFTDHTDKIRQTAILLLGWVTPKERERERERGREKEKERERERKERGVTSLLFWLELRTGRVVSYSITCSLITFLYFYIYVINYYLKTHSQ